MRYIYGTWITVFVFAVILFSLQNVGNVTISLFTMRATMPLALLVILVYVTGIFTGGFVLAILRRWIQGARRR